MTFFPPGPRRRLLVAIACPVAVVAVAVAAISFFGRPAGGAPPEHLTPDLFERLRVGDSRDRAESLLPHPRPANVRTDVHDAGSDEVEVVWTEFGVGGTFMSFVEFRLTFRAGRLAGKSRGRN